MGAGAPGGLLLLRPGVCVRSPRAGSGAHSAALDPRARGPAGKSAGRARPGAEPSGRGIGSSGRGLTVAARRKKIIEIRHRKTGAVVHRIEANSLARASLPGMNFSDADLTGMNLAGTDLTGALFRNA